MSDISKERAATLAHFKTNVHSRRAVLERVRGWIVRRTSIGRCDLGGTVGEGISPLRQANESGSGARSLAGTAIAKVIFGAGILLGVTYLFQFSLYLGAMHQYQVAECSNVFAARRLATGHALPGANLFQVLLSWLLPQASHSRDLYASARLIMLVLFWANCLLIALASGARLLSFRFLAAVAGAATLAPFWQCGFEVLPGNLLLSGVLLIWAGVRFRPATLTSYVFLGAVAATLNLTSTEGLFYAVPVSLGMILFPPPGSGIPRWKLGLGWAVGALGAVLLLRLVFGEAGAWHGFGMGVEGFAAAGNPRIWLGLAELFLAAPVLWALVVSALITVGLELRRRGKAALSWDGLLPEALLFAGLFAALLASGRPLPSTLVSVAPVAFLLAFRHVVALWNWILDRPAVYPALGAILVFIHLVPFATSVRRSTDWSNTRQEILMNLAEEITDPAKDAVFDAGIGMVPTRPSLDAQAPFSATTGKNVNGPAAVLISSYRTDQLPRAMRSFLDAHYVPLADDFRVLGQVLPAGGGTFRILHAGRYRIATMAGSYLAGTYPEGFEALLTPVPKGTVRGTLDGALFPGRPVYLTVGMHRLQTSAGCHATVVWVGPRLDHPVRLGQSDHRLLFRKASW